MISQPNFTTISTSIARAAIIIQDCRPILQLGSLGSLQGKCKCTTSQNTLIEQSEKSIQIPGLWTNTLVSRFQNISKMRDSLPNRSLTLSLNMYIPHVLQQQQRTHRTVLGRNLVYDLVESIELSLNRKHLTLAMSTRKTKQTFYHHI